MISISALIRFKSQTYYHASNASNPTQVLMKYLQIFPLRNLIGLLACHAQAVDITGRRHAFVAYIWQKSGYFIARRFVRVSRRVRVGHVSGRPAQCGHSMPSKVLEGVRAFIVALIQVWTDSSGRTMPSASTLLGEH